MVVLFTLLLIWRLTAACGHLIHRYAPTNIAIRYLRGPRGLKWAAPAALVLTPAYLLVASTLTTNIPNGGHEWLHIIAMLLIWNAMKFAILGALSPILLLGRPACSPSSGPQS